MVIDLLIIQCYERGINVFEFINCICVALRNI